MLSPAVPCHSSGVLTAERRLTRRAEIAKEKCQPEKMDKGRAEIDRGGEREIIKRSTAKEKGERAVRAGEVRGPAANERRGGKQEVSRWKSIWHSKA